MNVDDYQDDRFEWHLAKAASNLREHKVSFEVARLAFDDPLALDDMLVEDSDDEDRSKWVGLANGRLLVVIYTDRTGDDGVTRIRVISAWKANKHDQAQYIRG